MGTGASGIIRSITRSETQKATIAPLVSSQYFLISSSLLQNAVMFRLHDQNDQDDRIVVELPVHVKDAAVEKDDAELDSGDRGDGQDDDDPLVLRFISMEDAFARGDFDAPLHPLCLAVR